MGKKLHKKLLKLAQTLSSKGRNVPWVAHSLGHFTVHLGDAQVTLRRHMFPDEVVALTISSAIRPDGGRSVDETECPQLRQLYDKLMLGGCCKYSKLARSALAALQSIESEEDMGTQPHGICKGCDDYILLHNSNVPHCSCGRPDCGESSVPRLNKAKCYSSSGSCVNYGACNMNDGCMYAPEVINE